MFPYQGHPYQATYSQKVYDQEPVLSASLYRQQPSYSGSSRKQEATTRSFATPLGQNIIPEKLDDDEYVKEDYNLRYKFQQCNQPQMLDPYLDYRHMIPQYMVPNYIQSPQIVFPQGMRDQMGSLLPPPSGMTTPIESTGHSSQSFAHRPGLMQTPEFLMHPHGYYHHGYPVSFAYEMPGRNHSEMSNEGSADQSGAFQQFGYMYSPTPQYQWNSLSSNLKNHTGFTPYKHVGASEVDYLGPKIEKYSPTPSYLFLNEQQMAMNGKGANSRSQPSFPIYADLNPQISRNHSQSPLVPNLNENEPYQERLKRSPDKDTISHVQSDPTPVTEPQPLLKARTPHQVPLDIVKSTSSNFQVSSKTETPNIPFNYSLESAEPSDLSVLSNTSTFDSPNKEKEPTKPKHKNDGVEMETIAIPTNAKLEPKLQHNFKRMEPSFQLTPSFDPRSLALTKTLEGKSTGFLPFDIKDILTSSPESHQSQPQKSADLIAPQMSHKLSKGNPSILPQSVSNFHPATIAKRTRITNKHPLSKVVTADKNDELLHDTFRPVTGEEPPLKKRRIKSTGKASTLLTKEDNNIGQEPNLDKKSNPVAPKPIPLFQKRKGAKFRNRFEMIDLTTVSLSSETNKK